jgi:hypothetical protein
LKTKLRRNIAAVENGVMEGGEFIAGFKWLQHRLL